VSAPAPTGFTARQLATLALSHVETQNPMAAVRAAAWHNTLSRLGVRLPLFAVHDLGILLSQSQKEAAVSTGPRERLLAELRLRDEERQIVAGYGSLVAEIARCEAIERASGMRLRDELVAVVLTKLLRDLAQRWPERLQWSGAEELPLDPSLYAAPDLAMLWRALGSSQAVIGFARHLTQSRLALLTGVDQIDFDTLKLLGIFQSPGAAGAMEIADLYNAYISIEANDIVNFSLELIPSVLETKRASGVQVFSVDGYASIERHGNIDSLILSELAWDEELFERKVADDELYYYGHEKQREDERRLHYLLIDASASMRGVRQVFARGLALTLSKKLSLQGDEVWLRFFDSRLHDLVKIQRGGAMQVPYLLCFKSERGRNYARVFRQLTAELARHRRDRKRKVVLYILTHGECHIPVEIVTQLRQLAVLYGVFVLPSQGMAIDYAQLLHHAEIIDDDSLSNRAERRRRALGFVEIAGAQQKTG
jgi:hypothetical protein